MTTTDRGTHAFYTRSWRRSLGGVGLLCAVGLLVSSCSSRQTQADAAAEDAAGWVATELSGVSFERWSRPPTSLKEKLSSSQPTWYRVLSSSDEGAEVAVWQVDTGADPFTDDTPRTGVACAWIDRDDGSHRIQDCPRRLAQEVEPGMADWSDASAAYEAALDDIHSALVELQPEVTGGRVMSRSAVVAGLRRSGISVRPRGAKGAKNLLVDVRRTGTGPRISDTDQTVSATACATVGISLDTASYSIDEERPCSPKGQQMKASQ